ncbi:MAG: 4Fe-4S binding protein [Tidjanibacter sp.]|nr:4Fe-4S binding protein [Tidjanibacter sp.]
MELKYILTFPPESTFKSLIYDLVKEYNIRLSILRAEIEIGKGGQLIMAIENEQDNIGEAIEFLKSNGVSVSSMSDKVFHDSSRCVHCGSCVSSCPSGALTIAAPDWKLNFNPDKCIVCKLCLKSCPMGLFSMELIN